MMLCKHLLVASAVISQVTLHVFAVRPDKEAVKTSSEAAEQEQLWNARAEAVEAVITSLSHGSNAGSNAGALVEEKSKEAAETERQRIWDARAEAVQAVISSLSRVNGAGALVQQEQSREGEHESSDGAKLGPYEPLDCATVSAATPTVPECSGVPETGSSTEPTPAQVLERIKQCAVRVAEHIECAKTAHGTSSDFNEKYEMAFRKTSSHLDSLRNRKEAQEALAADQQKALTHLLAEATKVDVLQKKLKSHS